MKIYYNPKLKERARELRTNSTLAEVILWKYLKSRQLHGYQFMRQKPIDNYIVDLFCSKLSLVIEIDGDSHNHKKGYDENRQQKLEGLGLTFLRFYDREVKGNTLGVVDTINDWIIKSG